MTTRIAPGNGANLLGQHSAERNQDATVYVGALDSQVTEELLWELSVQAGPVANYGSFEASDAAIEAMNGQYLCNRQITVSYAYKKDTKGKEFWLPVTPVIRKTGHILCLQVDPYHLSMFPRKMVQWVLQLLQDLLQMMQFLWAKSSTSSSTTTTGLFIHANVCPTILAGS